MCSPHLSWPENMAPKFRMLRWWLFRMLAISPIWSNRKHSLKWYATFWPDFDLPARMSRFGVTVDSATPGQRGIGIGANEGHSTRVGAIRSQTPISATTIELWASQAPFGL